MDSMHPGRLRPWVRFHTPRGLVEARPDPTVSMTGWADILWDWCVYRKDAPLREHMTAFRPVALDWSMVADRRVRLSKAEMLELGAEQPEAAALAWGQNRPGSTTPWPRWKRWAAQAHRLIWPFGLLYSMAREGWTRAPAVPGYETEPWIVELTVTAANWLGVPAGLAIWNSLAAGGPLERQRRRWGLSFTTGSELEDGLSDASLERLLKVLSGARPEHQRHWRMLLDSEADPDDLRQAWGQNLDADQLREVTLDPSPGLLSILSTCPHRLREYLRESVPCPGRSESEVVNLFQQCSDWKLRVLLLACLQELQNSAPSEELLRLARRHPRGGELLQVVARWNEAVGECPIQLEGIDPAQLARLLHWRRLSGQSRELPKTLRSWVRGDQGMRQLLKIQQNFPKLCREEGARAWRALLQPFCLRLLAEFCGRPQVAAEHLEVGWLASCAGVSGSLLGSLFEPRSERNASWLRRAPSQLRQEVWLGGLDAGLQWRGQVFHASSADRWQSLRMGSDFRTCLTLKDGCYRASALLNALDINKQVLYLRRPDGQPVLRQLVAVTRCGRLQLYPVYSHLNSPELLGVWAELVLEYARLCGLTIAAPSSPVDQIHPMPGYYSDRPPRERPGLDREERDLLAAQSGPWRVWGQLAALRRGERLGFEPDGSVAAMLGQLGETDWLTGCSRYLPAGFLENLDYRADCAPLVAFFRRGGRGPGGGLVPPAALVSLPFGSLANVLVGLGRSIQWLEALCLLLIAWWRRPDPGALWRLLRGQSWLAELLPVYFRVIPDLPQHLRLAGRTTPGTVLGEWKIRCLEGLWLGLNGASGALKHWVSGLEKSWCLQVLGRLRLDGQLRMDANLLAFWCFEFGEDGWLALDLGLDWKAPCLETVAVGLQRSPEATWRYLDGLHAGARFGLMTQLIWLVPPQLWDQLAQWRPRRDSLDRADWLSAEMAAAHSFRLRQWLDCL